MASRARKLSKTIHSADLGAFCRLMIKTRKSAGLVQQALADRLQRPQSFVAKFERGERRIDVIEFIEICDALGADPVRLLKQLIKLRGGSAASSVVARVGK